MEVIELRQKLSEMIVHEEQEHASSGGARSNSPVQSFSSSLDAKAPQILPINDPSYTGSNTILSVIVSKNSITATISVKGPLV